MFILLTITAVIFAVLGISACGEKGKGKNFSYTTEYFEKLDLDLYSFAGHYYYVYKGHREWQSAEDYCESLGGHLATITSQEEQDFVEGIVKIADVACWLGAYKSGQNYVWVFGEDFEYSNWDYGEPSGGNEYYLGIYSNDSNNNYADTGKWNDFRSSSGTIQGFVCEWDDKDSVVNEFKYYNRIGSFEELKNLNNSSQDFLLTADIDLAGENWKPISGFSGTLDGGGHKIKNLTINSVNDSNLGLFGTLKGTVKNLTVENAQITSRGDAGTAGIVAGTNNGRIDGVTVSGTINPLYYNNVGGVVGYNNNSVVSNCTNDATVLGKNNVGGIAGKFIINGNNYGFGNLNNGEITGQVNVGGVFGYLSEATKKTDSDFSYSLSDNRNIGIINGKENIGGVIGQVEGAGKYSSSWYGYGYFNLSQLTNEGEVNSTGDKVGGIIGYGVRLSELTTSDNTADVSGGNYVGGYIGLSSGTNIKIANNSNSITGKGYVGGIAGYAGIIENATNDGQVLSTAIIVEDGASRTYLGGIAGFCTGLINCKNNSDITINEFGASYIGGCAGRVSIASNKQFNGNENYGKITGKDYVGGITGYLGMTTKKTDSNFAYQFNDNTNNGEVSGTSQVGGIAGAIIGAGKYSSSWYGYGYFNVTECYNNNLIYGTGDFIGGIFGYAERLTSLTVSDNKADVTGNNYVGGYIGRGSGTTIRLAVNNNTITGKAYVGGIAGEAGIMENCTNNGDINSNGIIVSDNSNKMSYVGGVAGYCAGAKMCTNNADITVRTEGRNVGGIAGFIVFNSDDDVNDNKNYGKIEGAWQVGGISGRLECATVKTDSNFTRSLKNNINYGSVKGTEYVGGIFGYVWGAGKYSSSWYGYGYIQVTNCTNEGEISGTAYCGGIIGGYTRLKTDANLIDTNTTLYGNKLGM